MFDSCASLMEAGDDGLVRTKLTTATSFTTAGIDQTRAPVIIWLYYLRFRRTFLGKARVLAYPDTS